MDHDHSSRVVSITVIATLISIPLLHHQGTFSFGGFWVIILLFFWLYRLARSNSSQFTKLKWSPNLILPTLLLLSQILGFTFFDYDINGIRTVSQATFRIGFITAIIITFRWIKNSSQNQAINHSSLTALFFIALLLRLCLPKIVVAPAVDIFDILKHGPAAVLSGKNPYQKHFGGYLDQPTPTGMTGFITYWPMAIYPFLFTAAFSLDPRILLAFSELALALLIYRDLNRKKTLPAIRVGLPLLFLYFPFFPVVTARAFVDPLILLFLHLALKFRRQDRLTLSGIMFGCLTATKYLYLPPMVVFASNFDRIRRHRPMLLAAAATTFLLLAPFLIWDTRSFLDQTVFIELKRQTAYLSQFGLGLAGFFWTQFQTLWITKSFWMILGLTLYFLLVFGKRFRSIELEYILTLFLLILVFPRPLGEQYYFLFGSLIIGASQLCLASKQREDAPASS